MNLRNVFVLFLLWMFLLESCKTKEQDVNLSSLTSLPVGTSNTLMPNYIVDKSGNYLFVFIRDVNIWRGVVKKINLLSLKIEKEITFEGAVPISPENILLTENNEIVTSFFDVVNLNMLLIKFNTDLEMMKVDSIKVWGGNYGRRRIVKSGPGKIFGVESNVDSNDVCYLRYFFMDEDLKVLDQKINFSSMYGTDLLLGNGLIKTSDGGYLYDAINFDAPFGIAEVYLEKLDPDFNIQWQAKYKTSADNTPTQLVEKNGNYYVWCHGNDSVNQKRLWELYTSLHNNFSVFIYFVNIINVNSEFGSVIS